MSFNSKLKSTVLVLLVILMMTFHYSDAQGQGLKYEKMAIQSCLTEQFLLDYSKYIRPLSSSDETDVAQTFNDLKSPGSKITDYSGTINDIKTDQIQKILDQWVSKGFISSTERSELEVFVTSEVMVKTIRETYYLKEDGDIMYGLIGYLTLSLSATSQHQPSATILYTFLKFRLATQPNGIIFSRSRGQCILWETYCFSSLEFKNGEGEDLVTEAQGRSLGTYLIGTAIQKWIEANEPYVSSIKSRSKQFQSFLPQGLKDAKAEIGNNPHKIPDQLFPQNPFDGNNFDL